MTQYRTAVIRSDTTQASVYVSPLYRSAVSGVSETRFVDSVRSYVTACHPWSVHCLCGPSTVTPVGAHRTRPPLWVWRPDSVLWTTTRGASVVCVCGVSVQCWLQRPCRFARSVPLALYRFCPACSSKAGDTRPIIFEQFPLILHFLHHLFQTMNFVQ